MKKLLSKKLIIPLILLIIAGSIAFSVIKYYKESITGEERLFYDMSFMSELQNVTEQLDTTIVLYYQGSIDEEAYLTQMKMIDDEMVLFMTQINRFNAGVKVRVGTHTLASKKGTDAASNIYQLVDNLVDYCMVDSYYTDKDKLVYMYLAQKKQIQNEMSEFSTCATAELIKDYEANKEEYDQAIKQMHETPTDTEED